MFGRKHSNKPFVLGISEEIWASGEAEDVAGWLTENLMAEQSKVREHWMNVEFSFPGAPADRPAWAVPEISTTLRSLDTHWPFGLFFLSRRGRTLEALQMSVGNARITMGANGAATLEHDQLKVAGHLARTWMPATRTACAMAGFGPKEVNRSVRTAMEYFAHGTLGANFGPH